MDIGTRSFQFHTPVVIVDQQTIAGPLEKQGNLTSFVDQFIDDLYDHERTFELCYNKLIRHTVQALLMRHPRVTFVFTGDLINQSTPTHYGLTDTQLVPMTYDYACASFGLSLANGALMLQQGPKQVIVGAMSHFAGAGATVPITSFGNALVHGALAEAEQSGIIGVIISMFQLTSAGITSAIVFRMIGALLFKPKS